jgi:hypothetical protein
MRTGMRCVGPHARGGGALLLLPVLALVVLACGCVEVKDTLTIRADGSGTVRIETVVAPTAMLQGFHSGVVSSDNEEFWYPPTNAQYARALFPGDAFEVRVEPNRGDKDTAGVIVEVKFKDVNALINSPYGRAHSLRLERNGDDLVLTTRSGVEHIAHAEQFLKAEHGQSMLAMLDAAAKDYNRFAFQFTVELPGPVEVEGAGVAADGNTLTWAVKPAEAEDRAKAAEQLDQVVTARCRAKDLAFTPEPVVRLDLCAFDKLADDKLADAPPVDVDKVKAQARFVPVALRVQRSFDLAGSGSPPFGGGNGTVLQGAIVVPRALEPERWGEPVVTYAVDDQGTDLLARTDDDDGPSWMRRPRVFISPFAEQPKDEAPDVISSFEAYLEPPDVDAEAIASIKGTIAMHYTGAQYVVRIKDAVAESSIIDASFDDYRVYGYGDDAEATPLSSDALAQLGLEITLTVAARVPGLLVLRFSFDDEQGRIERIQVFDADGRPWRGVTLVDLYGGFSPMRQRPAYGIAVVGAPKAPLSLAIVLRTAGPRVDVPFELTNVPLTPRSLHPEAAADADAHDADEQNANEQNADEPNADERNADERNAREEHDDDE